MSALVDEELTCILEGKHFYNRSLHGNDYISYIIRVRSMAHLRV